MKKSIISASLLLATTVSFAQIEVNNVGTIGIGATLSPNIDSAKLIMQSATKYSMYLTNTGVSQTNYYTTGNTYGIYTNNSAGPGTWYGAGVYGLYSVNNLNTSYGGIVYGAYLSATTPSTATGSAARTVYGLYSTVSGANAAQRYSGYFTGGKVVMTNAGGTIGLDVQGEVWSGGVKIGSDERLKTEIKPLSNEKDKLYLLQGKSYKKKLKPLASEEDTLAKNMEMIETQEFGYLAQELKEVFPELVGMDSTTGYYAVNYIGLIPIIIEALKDQQRTIAELKKELANKETNNLLKSSESETTQNMYLSENTTVEDLKLYQNAPNPFNQRTTVKCFVPEQFQKVQLCVYNMQGVQVQCITITERGNVSIEIEAGALSAGIYSYVLLADGAASETKQMILTK